VGNNKTTVEQPSSATAWLDLETVIRQLHASDLRADVQASDAGIQVWISDRLHRVHEERLFDRSRAALWREDSVALWLHQAALRLFPDNVYARKGMNRTSVDGGKSVDPHG
jgi:hypothetical protein